MQIPFMYSSVSADIIPLIKSMVEAAKPMTLSRHIVISFSSAIHECIIDHQPEEL